MSTQKKNFKEIADAIREKTKKTDLIKPIDFASEIDGVYEAGKKAQYDWFWDNFQERGNRTVYTSAFGCAWTAELFKPKYDIRPTNGYMMFYNNLWHPIIIDDFVEFCKKQGIVFDLSNCTNLSYGLGTLKTQRHGTLDLSSCTSCSYMFYSNYTVKTIEELICSEVTKFHTTTFEHATKLANINKVSGIIAYSINLQYCPLTKTSIKNVINALSPNANNQTITLKRSAVDNAFETSPGSVDGSISDEFLALTASKPNWSITLA